MKLTIRTIGALSPDKQQDVVVWDDELPGFGLRMKPSGVKSFVIQYRNANHVSRRVTLGRLGTLTPEEARKEGRKRLAEVAKGGDPAEARSEARKAMTVRQLCAAYLSATERGMILGKRGLPKKQSTLATDEGRIERHILPLLGSRKVRDLTTPDIVRFQRDVTVGRTTADVKTRKFGRAIVEGGRGAATRTVGLLGGIMSFALSEGIIASNPVRGVKRAADERRDVRLSLEQYRTLGAALGKAEDGMELWQAIAAMRLLALTGCRRGEIETLRWDEVDIPGRCLRLSDSKTGKSVRPLGAPAASVLNNLTHSGQFVLPGRDPRKPYVGLPKAWRRLLKIAREFGADTVSMAGLTPHSLRHGFASIAADLGLTEITIGALIGHSAATVTGRYIHHVDLALCAAADRVSAQIDAAMNGRDIGAEIVSPEEKQRLAVEYGIGQGNSRAAR